MNMSIEGSQGGDRTRAITPVLLADGLAKYLSTVSILKKGYEQERYRIQQICRSELAPMWVHEILSVDVAAYRDKRLATMNARTRAPLSPATVRLELSLLSNFFELARIEWGYTEAPNPCASIRKPKLPPGRDRRLTGREERLILRYAHNHSNRDLYSIIVLAMTTAMRQGEILSLRWEHINFKSRIAHLPATKNGTKRDVPLSHKAREALSRVDPRTSGPVFRYSSHGLKSTWRFMLQKLGIVDLHFHDLRHEAISRLFELGTLDMMEIAAISGHKSLSMLKRYTHLRASRLVNKLEGTRSKARQAVLNHLIPYPAVVAPAGHGQVEVLFPDFEHEKVAAYASSRDEAIRQAHDVLLRALVGLIQRGEVLPIPDQFLDEVDDGSLVMIDPLFA